MAASDLKMDLSVTGDAWGAICSVSHILKSSSIEFASLKFREGFSLTISKVSHPNDIYELYCVKRDYEGLKSKLLEPKKNNE